MGTHTFAEVIQAEVARLTAATVVLGVIPERTQGEIEGLQKAAQLIADTGACCK